MAKGHNLKEVYNIISPIMRENPRLSQREIAAMPEVPYCRHIISTAYMKFIREEM